MTTHSASLLVRATPREVMACLTAPGELADWNPAITRVRSGPDTVARTGDAFDAVALRVLRGRVEYLSVQRDSVHTRLSVPGLGERGSWFLRAVAEGTLVEHSLIQHGWLARRVAHDAPRVPHLRLDRLRSLLESAQP